MSLKKTVKQEELRKLMKQKTELERKKIDSPLAKYNSLGQLVCSVCLLVIKNETLWNAHLLSRSHREAVTSLQNNLKRPATQITVPPPPEKIIKFEEITKPKSILKNPLPQIKKDLITDANVNKSDKEFLEEKPLVLNDYNTSSDDDEDDDDDDDDAGGDQKSKENDKEETNEISKNSNLPQILPEGFFDDPAQDAKARKVVYKDRLEEEMMLFNKEIKEQSMVSETIVLQDEDEREKDRVIEEIDEQMSRWSRIEQLAKQKQPIVFKKKSQYFDNDDAVSDDDDDDNDDVNADDVWRTKSRIKNNKK